MATGGGYDTDNSSSSNSRERRIDRSINNPSVDIIKSGSVVSSFLTVELKHVVASAWDDQRDNVRQFDVFMRNCQSITDVAVPCTLEILESCVVPVCGGVCVLVCVTGVVVLIDSMYNLYA